MLPLFDRTLTLAVFEPMGRISGTTTFGGLNYHQDTSGFGDPMVEAGINLIGPKALKTIPDLLRYEPEFSLMSLSTSLSRSAIMTAVNR